MTFWCNDPIQASVWPQDLGPRICIVGPSTTGKSTLARALAAKLGRPAVYLDQYAFVPNTDWCLRPHADFAADHQRLIGANKWVMEGNYTKLIAQRLERATGLIWLDLPLIPAALRYVRRSLFGASTRVGGLTGAKGEFHWNMVHHILVVQRRNRRKLQDHYDASTDLTRVRVCSMAELTALHARWSL